MVFAIAVRKHTVKVVIDKQLCTGHGRCYTVAPDVFECDDDGYGVVAQDETPDNLADAAQIAGENCPERAISIVEA